MDRLSLKNEIIACGKDPIYFIKKYVKIQHPKKGIVPFDLFEYQDQLIKDYKEHRFNIVLKARQIGVSEVTAAYAVWMMTFHRDKNILVMASKADTAKNIIKKVKTTIKYLPDWLILSEVTTDNKLSVEMSNGSQIKAIATSHDAGRSEALSLLILDEAAFINGLDELWTGLYPTVAAGGSIIVMSTPNGVGNKFHSLYEESISGENEFKSTKLMWWVHPGRVEGIRDDPYRPGFKTSPWYEDEIRGAKMSPKDIAQELECEFLASGDTMISNEMLVEIEKGVIMPQSMEYIDRNLFVWWKPQQGKKYFIPADVARGDGTDYSAFHVLGVDRAEQCAEYKGKLPVEEYARLLCDTGRRYNDALIVVENNSVGLACLEHIRLSGYSNVYFSRKGDVTAGEMIDTRYEPDDNSLVIGLTMSPRTRPLILSKFEEYVRNRQLIIRSSRLVNELRTFVWVNGRAQAMKRKNDDLVVSAAIGVWIRDTFLMPNCSQEGLTEALIGGISVEKRENTQINGASKDPRFEAQRTLKPFYVDNDRDPYKIRVTRSRTGVDFSWLLKG